MVVLYKKGFLKNFAIFTGKHLPANIYLFKVNNRNTRKRCEIFKVNNKNTKTTVVLVFLLLTLNIFQPFSNVCIVYSEQVNLTWAVL